MVDRREFLQQLSVGAGAIAALSVLSRAASAVEPAGAVVESPAALSPALAAVAKTSSDCIRAGEACVSHCMEELAKGNTRMANCNRRVHDMLACCKAMLSLASAGSDLALRLAPICADACAACNEACLEHKEHWAHGMHLACKACHESCVECEKACRALTA